MVNSSLRAKRLARAEIQAAPDADFLLRNVAEELLERVSAVSRTFDNGIALFGRSPALADAMTASEQIKSVCRVEEASHWGQADIISNPTELGLEKASADLIIAPLTLHWSNDLPGTLIQLRQTLRPDGLLMAALPGPDTLQELRSALLAAESEVSGGAAMRIDPFTDIRDAGSLLQRCGYALPVVDQDQITVRYNSPLDLVQDLRHFGATNQREENSKPALTKAIVNRMLEIYSELFSDDDGRIRATFNMVWLSGWVPHESQQKPLKPGSAKNRLADALGVPETKL